VAGRGSAVWYGGAQQTSAGCERGSVQGPQHPRAARVGGAAGLHAGRRAGRRRRATMVMVAEAGGQGRREEIEADGQEAPPNRPL